MPASSTNNTTRRSKTRTPAPLGLSNMGKLPPQAPEMEESVLGALMIEKEMPIDNIKELVFPHPTVSEVIREALFMD